MNPEGVDRLRSQLGVQFASVRGLLRILADASTPVALGDLVEGSGVPHRRVVEVLDALAIDHASGEVGPLDAGARVALRAGISLGMARRAPEVLMALEEVAAGRPPSVWHLDHVPATTATIVARAEYLLEHYELAGARLVLLGDHDLTGIACALVAPQAQVTVVDIDERLLEYLDGVSERLGLGLRVVSADLRLGLPPSVAGAADLVFTDPPYSEEGVELFVRRGVEALADRPGASVLFCYGVNDRSPERLLATQEFLARRHLLLDALLPGFNRYRGAHAIGATSALWVCRPTRRTRPALAAQARKGSDPRIYSRGAASTDSGAPVLPARVSEVLAGWAGTPTWVAAQDLFEAAGEAPAPRWPPALAVDLGRHFGASAGRVLMAAPGRAAVALVGDARALAVPRDEPFRRLVTARYALAVASEATPGEPGVLIARPRRPDPARDAAGWVLAWLQDHRSARLRNAWREALCALAERLGGACTKNEARSLIEATALRPAELDGSLLDLPAHRLRALVQGVEQAVAGLRATKAPAAQPRAAPSAASRRTANPPRAGSG